MIVVVTLTHFVNSMLYKLLCYLESGGKHFELCRSLLGDQYCTKCETYLYTTYDQAAVLKDRRSLYKMWWQK